MFVYTDMRGDVRCTRIGRRAAARLCIMGHVRVSDIHQTRSHAGRRRLRQTFQLFHSVSTRVTALHWTSY